MSLIALLIVLSLVPVAFYLGRWHAMERMRDANSERLTEWGVQTEPEQDGEMSGIAIFITNGTKREMLTRVAYQRHMTRNPDASFDAQLVDAVNRLSRAAAQMNELDNDLSFLRRRIGP